MADSTDEEEFKGDEESSNDDAPLSSLARSAKRSAPNYKEGDDDEDDDDDDVPLSSLIQTKKLEKKTVVVKKKEPVSPKKRKVSLTPAPKAPNTSNKSYEFASAALYGMESAKGLLIQRLLCRWWYAMTWPDPAQLPAKPPAGYDSLEGFPGVYVRTSGEKVGSLKDVRDLQKAPSFLNFAKKPAEELQALLKQALLKQKEELIQHEGKGTALEKELDALLKWTEKVNPSKADKDAQKILKAQGLSLD
ncbi:hypothetical protein FisN_6Hh263 [Fistulifera solaris]|uniref:Uncharacterized protein n=1 Tax=Fistulifera solaris TaxID=1519565 RepID=A0A1Z5K715_FISSO|nr:hypothetical protein FisN_6Hh263 [Fistulifera solaris]|eukprot:GAX22016.1 hypothetical protein FisN_6Hh263 [Fistulifera solaris]